MKKVLVFDFNGVIVDSFPICFAVTQMYDPELTEKEYKLMFTGNIYDSLAARGERIKRDPDPNFDFFAEYTKRIVALKPVEGIRSVLEKATELGLKDIYYFLH